MTVPVSEMRERSGKCEREILGEVMKERWPSRSLTGDGVLGENASDEDKVPQAEKSDEREGVS